MTSPSDAAEAKFTNRLIHETSPYLRQHAHNPVDWQPWDAEALEQARKEDKPILLGINTALQLQVGRDTLDGVVEVVSEGHWKLFNA